MVGLASRIALMIKIFFTSITILVEDLKALKLNANLLRSSTSRIS